MNTQAAHYMYCSRHYFAFFLLLL
eukprot:SAG22_NODE_16722_length_319_cov_0.940909_2_plen_23_part_01